MARGTMAQDTAAEPRKHVTISDIAKAAGVAKSTVSYALNGKPGVGAEQRRRIVDLARELEFRQSHAARALSNARADAIGFVTPFPNATTLGFNLFYLDFLAGVEQELGAHDQALLIRTAPNVDTELAVYRQWAKDGRVDGVILADQRVGDPRPAAARELGLPAVIAGQRSVAGIPAVRADDEKAAELAVRYLVGLGHRRIARVPGASSYVHTRIRGAAFDRALRSAGLSAPDVRLRSDGDRATRQLLALPQPPTAILYESAGAAIDGIRAATAMGVDVPGALSIVAWDDSPVLELITPPLTALHRDVFQFGMACARRLLALLAGTGPSKEDEIPVMLTELRERGSAAPPP